MPIFQWQFPEDSSVPSALGATTVTPQVPSAAPAVSASVLLNGMPVLEGNIHLGRIGAWFGQLSVDATEGVSLPPGTPAIIRLGDLILIGTIIRSGLWKERLRCRVVAGAGKWWKAKATPKMYVGVTFKLILLDLLLAAGELLSPIADPLTLATLFTSWVQMSQGCVAALDSLLSAPQIPQVPQAKTAWRFQPDGTLWIGPEIYPTIDNAVEFVQTEQFPELGRVEIASESFAVVLPGVTLAGARIGSVHHWINQNRIRSTCGFEFYNLKALDG